MKFQIINATLILNKLEETAGKLRAKYVKLCI